MENKELDRINIGGMILSGGKSRRMGTDKSLKLINNKKLIDIVIEKTLKQVKYVFVNSNSLTQNHLKLKNIDIVNDFIDGQLGPLAGIVSGMKWLKKTKPEFKFLLSIPVDSPFFPDDLVKKFIPHIFTNEIVLASSNERNHPVFSIWNLNLEKDLENSLKKGVRKIEEFTRKKKTKVVKFENFRYDPFFNINTKADLDKAKKYFF